MHMRRGALVALALVSLAACSDYGATSPDGGGGGGDDDVSATVSDPQGDTFGAKETQWDLTALSITRDADGITATLDFAQNVISPLSGNTSATIAFLDLDLDQDVATGAPAVADGFRRDGGSTQLGVEARVILGFLHGDGSAAVVDVNGDEVGRVTPTFEGHRITVRVPKALLGDDDGKLNAAAAAGTVSEGTDIIPEAGHLTLGRVE